MNRVWAGGAPAARVRSAEEIDADLWLVDGERIAMVREAGTGVPNAAAMAELFQREVALWEELLAVAPAPFVGAVSAATSHARSQAEWWRGRAGRATTAALSLVPGGAR